MRPMRRPKSRVPTAYMRSTDRTPAIADGRQLVAADIPATAWNGISA